MPDHRNIDWDRARWDYEAAICSRPAIARKYGVTYDELRVRATVNKWSEAKRSTSTDRMILIERIMGALEQQVEHMEKREMTPTGEKEAAVLGKLTSTLGTLIGFAAAEARGPAAEMETAEMRDIRNQLAKRINALTKG